MMIQKKTYINTNDIKNNLADFNSRIARINEIFENVNKDMRQAKGLKHWQGQTSDAVFEKYELLSNNYETIINSLQKLSKFVSSVASVYEDFDEKSSQFIANSDLDM